MSLSDEELSLLERSIQVIELQNGCPNQCIVCGHDAPPLRRHLAIDDYLTLSESIEEVRETRGIELLKDSYIYPFLGSDPVFYPWLPKVVSDINKRHFRDVILNTAGWTPKNTRVQRNMEEIVEVSSDHQVSMGFSIKAVSALAMQDWDKWLQRELGTLDNKIILKNTNELEEKLSDFFHTSRFAQHMVSNLNTLKDMPLYGSVQYTSSQKIHELPDKYLRFSPLFSFNCAYALSDWVIHNSDIDHLEMLEPRSFSGVGRAVSKLGFKPNSMTTKNIEIIKEELDTSVKDDVHNPIKRSAIINSNGSIKLYLGEASAMESSLIPKEYFEARARHYAQKPMFRDKQRIYEMLSNLQGRNLLSGDADG